MSGGERLLIVNADDLGSSPGVNDGIFEAHRRGLVTSATLMVGYPGAEHAAAALAEHPRLGVGLHLTLSGRRPPLVPAARVPSLVDADGLLPARPESQAAAAPDEVRAELAAQLDRFRELTGRLPTHLDGHHHCHRQPPVLEAVIETARRHALPVRRASPAVARRLAAGGVATTDAFDERFFGDGVRLELLLDLLAGLEPGVTELMCHPGRVDEALRSHSSYTAEREDEIAVLTDDGALAACRDAGIRLVHFGHLARR